MNFWHIKWNSCLCDKPLLNTGVPLGHVISSFLLSIYMNEIICNNNGLILIKRFDNTTQEANFDTQSVIAKKKKKKVIAKLTVQFDYCHLGKKKGA